MLSYIVIAAVIGLTVSAQEPPNCAWKPRATVNGMSCCLRDSIPGCRCMNPPEEIPADSGAPLCGRSGGGCPSLHPLMAIGICVEMCSDHADCSNGQMCCSNGCGHECKDPEPIVTVDNYDCPDIRCQQDLGCDGSSLKKDSNCCPMCECQSQETTPAHSLDQISACLGGMVWKECGSPCTRTCSEPNPICIEMCAAKCECPNGQVWHEEKEQCVDMAECSTSETDYRPQANAGSAQIISLPKNSITLYGNASSDDKGIASYEWMRTDDRLTADMQGVRTPFLHLSNLQLGDYTFMLKVTDTSGQTDTVEVNVFVEPEHNQAPEAHAGEDQTVMIPESQSATLDGSKSTDDKKITSYQWKQIKGPNTADIIHDDQAVATVTNLVIGEYIFELVVADKEGLTGKDRLNVLVQEMCTGGQEWFECGMACTATCDEPNPICNRMCAARCQCPSSKPIFHEGVCKELMDCPVPAQEPTDHCPEGCPKGQTCQQQQVQCFRAPCPLMWTCLPEPEMPCAMPMCATRCEYGYALDARGCMTCDCRSTPQSNCPVELCADSCGYTTDEYGCKKCTPCTKECPMFKCVPCKYGYETDENGCQTCDCIQTPRRHLCPMVMCANYCPFGRREMDALAHCTGCECAGLDMYGLVGVTLGGAVLIAILVILTVCCCRTAKKRQGKYNMIVAAMTKQPAYEKMRENSVSFKASVPKDGSEADITVKKPVSV